MANRQIFKSLYILLLLLCSLCCNNVWAHTNTTPYNITKLSVADGLSQNDILDIYQDSFGFVWIATNDGLNRYDGYGFRLFKKGGRGLDSNLPVSICEDSHHNLWIGTADKGIYYYLRDENRFLHISEMTDSEALSTMETTNCLVMGADSELFLYVHQTANLVRLGYDVERLRVVESDLFPTRQLSNAHVNDIIYRDGELFLSTYWGMLKWSRLTGEIARIDNFNLAILDIELHGDKIYAATNKGIYSYDLKSATPKRVVDLESCYKICWSGVKLYIATDSGAFITTYSRGNDEFSQLIQIDRYQNFTANKFTPIESGGVWLGFDKEAIRIFQQNKKPFQLVQGYGNNHILSIFGDHKGRTWVGTDSGLYIHHSDDLSSADTEKYLDGFKVVSVVYSNYSSRYYIATRSGIYSCVDGSKIERMDQTTTTRKLLVDGKYLWIACYNSGLKRYDMSSGEMTSFTTQNSDISSDIVRSMVLSRDGSLWLATAKGVVMVDAQEKANNYLSFTPILPEQTAEHYAISMYESHAGDIWYGTMDAGLHRVVRNSGEYQIHSYTTENGLPSNNAKSITEDVNNNIWVALSSGLCCMNVDKHITTSYRVNDGALNNEFQDLAAWSMSNRTLLFGGANGITQFDPREIETDYTQGEPHLTDFKVFNSSILDDDNMRNITPRSIERCSEIKLRHHQNSFTFHFSSFNYIGLKSQKYQYMLEGFDTDWKTVDSNIKEASYTNIPYGNYTFVVQCSNADGLINPKKLLVDVVIAPPFYLTWYAYVFYIIAFLTITTLFLYLYRAMLLRKNVVELAKMEKMKMEELLALRTNFFTNVSHEFRTPLTLILTPLQQVMDDPEAMNNPKWRNCFRTMAFNGESLMRLVGDFLSYSKRERGDLTLNLELSQLDKLIEELSLNLAFMAKSKGVKLNFTPPTTPVLCYFDAIHMEQIVYNLTSNAIKHTCAGGEVNIFVSEREDCVEIVVNDSGVGIPYDLQATIFERFVSHDTFASKRNSGIGIGLSLTKELVEMHNGSISFVSIPEVGTTFTVTLAKQNRTEQPTEDVVESVISNGINHVIITEQATPKEDCEQPLMLIVDDNEQLVKVLASLFESDYKVIIAQDGAEGLEMAQTFVPDVIISDVMMPKMDGYELCDRVKRNDTTSHIPIVLLTAKSSIEDMAIGYKYKADSYCTKPFNNRVLVEMISSILENRRVLANRVKQSDSIIDIEQAGITTEGDKQLVKRIVCYVEENMSNSEIVVNDVCAVVGLSQPILNKKLKSLLNMTTVAFIRNIRLKRAAELLRTGRYNVTDVTYETGFNDLRYFRESFKKEYGMFPLEYKNRYNTSTSIIDE